MPKKIRKPKIASKLDQDTYDLDHTIIKFILPRLKRFRKLHDCHPNTETMASWNTKLDQMIKAFEISIDSDGLTRSDDVQKGYDLFGRHLSDLWW